MSFSSAFLSAFLLLLLLLQELEGRQGEEVAVAAEEKKRKKSEHEAEAGVERKEVRRRRGKNSKPKEQTLSLISRPFSPLSVLTHRDPRNKRSSSSSSRTRARKKEASFERQTGVERNEARRILKKKTPKTIPPPHQATACSAP